MRIQTSDQLAQLRDQSVAIDVSIVMPCLNETLSLPHCIANAREALNRIAVQYGLHGEIVIADNGSTDGSQALAESLGARVVNVIDKGYGAALIGGCSGAYGRYLLMGDADGSYDFTDGVAMIGKLVEGADLCMGSRFKGGIAPGAMPWKNRYIGNPVLTGILNILFRTRIDDAHCGLRAITRDTFAQLRLTGSGMEFASEMVIKAALRKCRIDEVPATLSVDLRDREPHLRPWRDGWRHLRYLMMLSPIWIFGVPAAAGALAAIAIFAQALLHALVPGFAPHIGNYWVIAGGGLATISHLAALMALAAHLHGVRQGYREPGFFAGRIANWLSLESMLAGAVAAVVTGGAVLATVVMAWAARDFGPAASVLAPVFGTVLLTIGAQTALGGFLLAVLAGNEARFVNANTPASADAALPWPRAA